MRLVGRKLVLQPVSVGMEAGTAEEIFLAFVSTLNQQALNTIQTPYVAPWKLFWKGRKNCDPFIFQK